MSEAIIARGGRKGSGGGSDFHGLMTEVYTSSTMWLVPSNAVNNEFSVRIFGGGGGGMAQDIQADVTAAGGGGWMNNSTLILEPGGLIFIEIGSGGDQLTYSGMGYNNVNTSGGTTSFGIYLSANGGRGGSPIGGGSGGSGGGGWNSGGTGYQFGGGGSEYGVGGNGGPWGGGYVNPGGGGGYGRGAQYCEYNLGHGKNMTWYTAGYGGGGAGSFGMFGSSNYCNGGNGICIVQYYKKV